MGLSDTNEIMQYLRSRGHTGAEAPRHHWTIITTAAASRHDDESVRAVCAQCGLIRRKPLSVNAEIYIDLSGPCPMDSTYWRTLQQERAQARATTT